MLFSIITITRNNLQGLKKTHVSLAAQKSANFEWVVIDGGSDDGSVKWLEKTSAKWINEPDNGIFDAMNKGLALAQAEYLLFLNAGDRLTDDLTLNLLEQVINAQVSRPGFIYGDSYEERGHKPPAYKKARPHTGVAKGMFTHHQAMLYRRDLV